MATESTATFHAVCSTTAETNDAFQEICDSVKQACPDGIDFGVLFVSHHHADKFETLGLDFRTELGIRNLLGCGAESVIGDQQEIEGSAAMSLWVARLPNAEFIPMHIEFDETPDGLSFHGWPDDLPLDWPAGSVMFVLGEPFTFPIDRLLERINEDQPGVPVVGGMASGATKLGQNRLFLDDQVITAGAIGVLIHGGVRIRTIVSQGCRPIGRHLVVTKAERNVILELGGRPALEVLSGIYEGMDDSEQELVQQGLHVGRVIDEYKDEFQSGDFLIRNVIGIDPQAGAVAVGDLIRAGQTIQFQLRDQVSATGDLKQLLTTACEDGCQPSAALLFTCNGRGSRLFDNLHHDVSALHEAFGDIPVTGFFAQGEIGPVGGQNFIHGYTASVALFEAIDPSEEEAPDK